MRALFLASAFAVWRVAAQNCSSCNLVADSLGQCNLPGLGTNWTQVLRPPQHRNVIGLTLGDLEDQGPETIQLTNYSQAHCLCTDRTVDLAECAACLNQTVANFTIQDNYRRNSEVFLEDCNAFGYYQNATLAYPSTTRLVTPSQTGTETQCNICGIIDGQLKSCGLPVLTAVPPNGNKTILDENNSNYTAYLLFNRKAGECFCTVPVLNLFSACHSCVDDKSNPQKMVEYYRTDCHSLGYWAEPLVDSKSISYEQPSGTATASNGRSDARALRTRLQNLAAIFIVYVFLQL